MNKNDVLTDPQKLVRLELKNEGFDLDQIHVPQRVFLLADSIYDAMLAKNCGSYKYPLGGKLFVFQEDERVGFVKGGTGDRYDPSFAGSMTGRNLCIYIIITRQAPVPFGICRS